MAQLSRPFQIALGVCVLFALLWFALLHRPGSGTSSVSSGSSASAPAHASAPHPARPVQSATAGDPAKNAGDSAKKTDGAAAAHVRATHVHSTHVRVTHVRGTDVHNSTHVRVTHTSATGGTSVHTHKTTVAPHPAQVAPRSSQSATRHSSPAAPAKSNSTPAKSNSSSTPALQATVAAELKQGKVALLLFWNPKATDDAAVHGQVQAVGHKLGGRVAVHYASASQVGSFGSITRDIQIYQTPTLLIVNPHRQVTTLTGYTEAFAIEQAIAEARK